MPRRIALITGATSGIGRATAVAMAKDGIDLILCGRRMERLEHLKKELSVNCFLLSFDVGLREMVEVAIKSIPKEFSNIDILINNAGNAHGLDSVQVASIDDWDAMIDSNVKGLFYVTKLVLDQMIKRNSGHIINVGSIAGKEVYPKGSVYCSSKFAVDAFTKGLRMDVNPYHIKVGAIHPGLVETEFSLVRFKGNSDVAKQVYQGLDPLVGDDVAQAIMYMINTPAHVNIADLVILPTAQASSSVLNRT